MKLNWIITAEDEQRYRDFVDKNKTRTVVLKRLSRNIERSNIDISIQSVWTHLVRCLLTTQQRSGARSRVSQFINSNAQLFSLEFCRDSNDLASVAKAALKESGLRRTDGIAAEINNAIEFFRSGSFQEFELKLQSITKETAVKRERNVARWIQRQFKGFGPKQSRNLIQWLGLSQYEIPLDSRMAKVLRKLDFPVPLSSAALADEEYYCFVEDGLHIILSRIEVVPCIFDACAFASFEKD